MTPRRRSAAQAFWLLIALTGTAHAQWRSFARDVLAAHNAVRARVGVTPLAWSDRLAQRSQEWADTLLARRQFMHRPSSPYGENLFDIRGGVASPTQVIGEWASEARDYDYISNVCRGVCGHYTQLFGVEPKKWAAASRAAGGARCGFAIMTRQGIGPAGGLTSVG